MNNDDILEKFEELKEQYSELRDQQIQVKTNLERSQSDLEELKKQAREEFGTDNLSKLQALLEKRELENQAKVQEYQFHLEHIQESLKEVERSIDEEAALDGEPKSI
jgi:phage shock protein A